MTIAVFDSGMGGLTILKALKRRLSAFHFIYLGDTARLPYGTKSSQTVQHYAHHALHFLQQFQPEAVVIACNTASGAALETLQQSYPEIPFYNVVTPAAEQAVHLSQNNHILVLATEATVRDGAYLKNLRRACPDILVTEIACPLFVTMAEEGWISGPEVEAVIRRSLKDFFDCPPNKRPDTVILGCTHFPVLLPSLKKVLPPEMIIIDSAGPLANIMAKQIDGAATPGSIRFFVTDHPQRFQRVGSIFLEQSLSENDITLVNLMEDPAVTPASVR